MKSKTIRRSISQSQGMERKGACIQTHMHKHTHKRTYSYSGESLNNINPHVCIFMCAYSFHFPISSFLLAKTAMDTDMDRTG